MKILSLYYQELMGKIEEYEEKKYLMVDDYMLHEALDKIKNIIGIEKFDDANILMDTDDKFLDDITLKNAVISMTCVIEDNGKFYLKIFLEEALYA